MSTFAIFYKRSDCAAIAAEAQNLNLTPQERQHGLRLWNAGLKDWAVAPEAPPAYACVTIPFEPVPGQVDPDSTWSQNPDGSWLVCDPDMRILVLSGSQVSKQQTVDWLRLIGNKYPGAVYMAALGDDVASTAVEPWP